jgi:TGF-beta propeptide
MKNSKRQLLPALILLLCSFSWVGAYGQITPSQDAFTNTAAASTNYGANVLLNVNGAKEIAYIQFNLASIPASATVSKATLKLYVNAVTTAGSLNVDFVNGSWAESTITSSLSPVLGTTIEASVPLTTASKNQYILIDVTSAVQAWLSGSQANDGIALVANGTFDASFDSKENTTTSHPAELDVVFAGGGGSGITGITTASGSGLIGGGTSGTLNLSLTTACATNQVLAWTGTAWACATPKGTGTVTSVGLSAPASDFTVSGSPVTQSGTLALNWSVAPTSADTANAIVKRDSTGSFSAGAIASTLSSGTAIFGATGSGIGVYGDSSGTGSGNNGVEGDSSAQAGSGVAGINTGGGIGLYGQARGGTGIVGTGATGVFGTGTSYGFATDSNAQQARSAGGWAKALVSVNGGSAPYNILRCYNSTLAGSAATTPPCGFNLTEVSYAVFDIDFGFEVDDRFWSVSNEGYVLHGNSENISETVFADTNGAGNNSLQVQLITGGGDPQGTNFTVVLF